ncbi:zinc metalloproteinase nas-14-like [Bolinopsis microptera]|uniref:zinc metalloproteinase nas-14-like n=1 Tax=Bolinopsis microptera TaxID=2820187 RepID=UPI00307995E2
MRNALCFLLGLFALSQSTTVLFKRAAGDEFDPEGDDTNRDPDQCKDLNFHCSDWKDAGYCCTCDEGDTNCKYWAREGYCTGDNHQEWMSENCKKSCNRCPREEEEEEEEEKEEETGEKEGEKEEENEEEKEERIEEPENLTLEDCYDKPQKKCKKRAKKGHCTRSSKAKYMKKNCKKSCKMC